MRQQLLAPNMLKSLPSQAHSFTPPTPKTYGMDPVLAVLQEPQLKRSHIDSVCNLFDAVESRDIYTAFEILCKLQKYLGETNSWSFKLLSTHDFDTPGNKFELNLAVMVAERSQKLLTQMQRWDLRALKRKVRTLPRYSDWAMILTSLVLRISSVSQTTEFNLRIALSRATLVKIHCELSLEMPDEDESSPLVHKYRSFVKELLLELESATNPQDSEKIFKTVSDIKHMFKSYKDQGQQQSAGTQQQTQIEDDLGDQVPQFYNTPGSVGSASSSGSTSSARTISASSGILNSSVLGAFESAHNEQYLTSLIKPSKEKDVLMNNGKMQVLRNGKFVDTQSLFTKGLSVHPSALRKPAPEAGQKPTKSNIATTSLMNAMRTGRWA